MFTHDVILFSRREAPTLRGRRNDMLRADPLDAYIGKPDCFPPLNPVLIIKCPEQSDRVRSKVSRTPESLAVHGSIQTPILFIGDANQHPADLANEEIRYSAALAIRAHIGFFPDADVQFSARVR